MQLLAGISRARLSLSATFCSLALLASTALASAPGLAQSDDELFEEDEVEAEEELGEEEGEKALADTPSTAPDEEVSADLVRARDREPPAGTPLIANKKYPMAFRFELTGSFDFSYGERFVRQTGGHVAAGMHIFDWLQVEAFGGYMGLCAVNTPAGLFHPAGCELGITRAVRRDGRSVNELGEQPKLSDLWQTGGFGGVTVQWAPIYGKLSMVSEYDLSFQLYGFGGLGIDQIWKVETQIAGGAFQYDLVSPDIPVAPSAHFGAGLRLIPWKYIAIRAELRNYVRVNPAVDQTDYPDLDIGWNSMVNLGVSFIL